MASQDMTERGNIKRGNARRERRPPKKITEKFLYNSGLSYLQRFPASSHQFRRIMGRKIDRSCAAHADQDKEACLQLLEKTVETFQGMGLLNDDQYLQGMITSLRRRGLSAQAISAKLASKGLKGAIVKDALAGDGTPYEDDINAALRLARRKKLGPFRGHKAVETEKEMAALGRAGYSYDIAQQILSMSAGDAEAKLLQSS